MTELTLHIPSDKELSYRSYLILDEATMSYNMGYGDNGGCTYHKTAEELYEWYQYWKTPDRFYAYIQRDKDHAFIGEVSLHKNERIFSSRIESPFRTCLYKNERQSGS